MFFACRSAIFSENGLNGAQRLNGSNDLNVFIHRSSGKPAITATVIAAVSAVKCQYSATL